MFNTIVDNCQRIIQNTKLTDISNKKVLVTGASGLIGIHLVKSLALLEQGNERI